MSHVTDIHSSCDSRTSHVPYTEAVCHTHLAIFEDSHGVSHRMSQVTDTHESCHLRTRRVTYAESVYHTPEAVFEGRTAFYA